MKLVLITLLALSSAFSYCFEQAGTYYGVSPALLYAIAKVESNLNWRALNKNRNGTYDIGLMQINSRWLPILKRYGLYNKSSIWEPCYNTMVGAWVLRHCIDRYGNTWKAIDCYNKGSKARENSQYVWKVYRAYMQIARR